MKVGFTPEAHADLTGIFAYLEALNPPAAVRTVDRLRARCLALAQHPRRGVRLGDLDGDEIRRIVEMPFVVIYSCSRILRVFHGARDLRGAIPTLLAHDDRD